MEISQKLRRSHELRIVLKEIIFCADQLTAEIQIVKT